MPPLARSVPDQLGLFLIDTWISSWPSCEGPDADSDTVKDATDNCIEVPNPSQADANSNGIGDACEASCNDGLDNDGDGLVDFPADPGCGARLSSTESPACNDGFDNDGDGLVDSPLDPGCGAPSQDTETKSCQNGVDDDGDGRIDFDGGASAGLGPSQITDPDPSCRLAITNEQGKCGLGFELALLLPIVTGLRGRRRRAAA
jgi:hypothetical protein